MSSIAVGSTWHDHVNKSLLVRVLDNRQREIVATLFFMEEHEKLGFLLRPQVKPVVIDRRHFESGQLEEMA